MSSPAQALGSWVRIPLETWMSVYLCCVCVVVVQAAALRGTDPPFKESYRLSTKFTTSELLMTANRPDGLIRQGRTNAMGLLHHHGKKSMLWSKSVFSFILLYWNLSVSPINNHGHPLELVHLFHTLSATTLNGAERPSSGWGRSTPEKASWYPPDGTGVGGTGRPEEVTKWKIPVPAGGWTLVILPIARSFTYFVIRANVLV
jgi:hypothetical protein